MDFRPDKLAEKGWLPVPEGTAFFTRQEDGDFRADVARKIRDPEYDPPELPEIYASENDKDGDGILDREDALLFTANEPMSWEVRVEPVVLSPKTDGLTPEMEGDKRVFDFGPVGESVAKGFRRDSGKVFSGPRGYGWTRDLSDSHRKRGAVPEGRRDTFIFTRSEDVWELVLENGSYRVITCVGDSGHPQPEQNVVIEGKQVVKDHSTAAGEWLETEVEVEVKDGRLTVEIGREKGGANTCLNWLIVQPANR